jgi:adenylate cyclase class IV
MKNIEVEVKYYLSNYDQVKLFLDTHAEKQKIEEVQEDTYFTPAHENFLDQTPTIDKWLRIRKTNK